MHKLLLADDSVTIQRVIELTFSGEDVHVVAVNDGEQAIARIPVERPDVVLADIGMPRKGGYDVSAFVKGRTDLAHIPVLLLAGAFEPVDQARAEQVHADGVLIKPFEPRQVIERVKELLAIVPQAAPAPQLTPAAVETAAPAARSLDELFESLNQAVAEPPAAVPEAPAAEPEPVPEPVIRSAPEPVADPFVVGPPLSFEPLSPSPRNGATLDDYFERLSAAFEQASRPSMRVYPPMPERLEDLAPAPPAAPGAADEGPAQEWLAPSGFAPAFDHGGQGTNPILEAVTALMAEANGHEPGHVQGEVPSPSPAPAAAPLVAVESQAMVDAITDRVLARLTLEVAESLRRLVAQEIARAQHDRR